MNFVINFKLKNSSLPYYESSNILLKMKKEIFNKIFGSSFKVTNYKVNSPQELKNILTKKRLELDPKIYTIENNGNSTMIELPNEATINEIGLFHLLDSYHINGYFDFMDETRKYYNIQIQRIKFMITDESKSLLLQNELKTLESEFISNPYNQVLTPDNYFNELNSYDFYVRLWSSFKMENRSLYYLFCEHHKNSFQLENFFTDNLYPNNSFKQFMVILQKFTLIKYQLSLIKSENKTAKQVELDNNYPSIFTDGYSLNLFNFLIDNEEKKVGRAYITKYFNLFKEENLIKKNAKKTNFLRFLSSKHNLDFRKLDNRTTYTDEEIENLDNVRIKFKKQSPL